MTRRELAATAFACAAARAQTEEPVFASVVAMTRMIREKKISARELVDAHIARIQAVNGKINAVVQTCFERARAEAAEADRKLARGETTSPLHGIPMTLKDSIDTAGVITTGGTLGRMNFVPQKDATVAARLRKAGAILLGKTNTPEFTLGRGAIPGVGTTANILYGMSRNPYDLTRSTAGSSGGAGAIVAAGGAPFDIGSDWNGSIRGPAHNNGIAGIKPTSGRVPRTGHIVDYGGPYDYWQQLGPMARRVEDLILLLPLIAGPDFRDAAIVPVPWRSPESVTLAKLRVSFYTSNGVAETTPETRETVRKAAIILEKAGGVVKEDFPRDLIVAMDVVREEFMRADGWNFVKRLAEREKSQAISPMFAEWMKTPPIPTPDFSALWERQDELRSKLLQWVRGYDVVLCPAAGKPAQPIQSETYSRRAPGLSYTGIYNSLGWPAAVVRCGTSPEGLPIGVQVIGRPWREDVVLAVSMQLEAETGGWQRPPL
jgi:amidase